MIRFRTVLPLLAVVCALIATSACFPGRAGRRRAALERRLQQARLVDSAAAIRAGDASWIKGAETKDLDLCMASYLDDAVVISAGQPAVVGRENIRKFTQELIDAPGMHVEFSDATIDVAQSNDLAVDRGIAHVTTTDKQGKPVSSVSEYVLVWKRQADGSWKIYADTSAPMK